MTLKNRILGSVFHFSRHSTDPSAQSQPTSGRSAPWAENYSNSSVTADDLIQYLGDDIDLFDVNSVNDDESERLHQLKAVGERWPNSRVNAVGGEWRW
jgi:hypothetical protein